MSALLSSAQELTEKIAVPAHYKFGELIEGIELVESHMLQDRIRTALRR